jgi:hypothetical protein
MHSGLWGPGNLLEIVSQKASWEKEEVNDIRQNGIQFKWNHKNKNL